jgi:hypothetical protein
MIPRTAACPSFIPNETQNLDISVNGGDACPSCDLERIFAKNQLRRVRLIKPIVLLI